MANVPDGDPAHNDTQLGEQPSPISAVLQGPDARAEKDPKKLALVTAKEVFFGFVGVVAVALIGYTFTHWLEERIDKTVEAKLSDPTILRKIAAESRPTLIFNANESYVADEGAQQFIKELKVTKKIVFDSDTNLPAHVHIEFTKFLPFSPLVMPVSQFTCTVTSERGKGNSWEFDLNWAGFSQESTNGNQLFRLEILP